MYTHKQELIDKYDKYQNEDGTYTSLTNGKTYKTLAAFICHMSCQNNKISENSKIKYKEYVENNRINCKFCNKSIVDFNLEKHETSCYLNPINIKLCEICGEPIKYYKYNKGVCSISCSNKLIKRGICSESSIENRKLNYLNHNYRSICFENHDKKCIICGELNIISVHHYDYDHNNNDPKNLIPLCPTHHQYMHSRYKYLIENEINNYLVGVENYDISPFRSQAGCSASELHPDIN